MSYVSNFEREANSPFYLVNTCDKQDDTKCISQNNQFFLFKNSESQEVVSPAIPNKSSSLFFIPEAEMQNINVNSKLKPYFGKGKCWDIDPCTPNVADFCCDSDYTYVKQDGDEEVKQQAKEDGGQGSDEKEENDETGAEDEGEGGFKLSTTFMVVIFIVFTLLILLMIAVAVMV